MTIAKLASEIALAEGNKSQTRIGDIREILAILVKLDAKHVRDNGPEDSPLSMLMERSVKKIKGLKSAR